MNQMTMEMSLELQQETPAPDAACITTPDGGCAAVECMHTTAAPKPIRQTGVVVASNMPETPVGTTMQIETTFTEHGLVQRIVGSATPPAPAKQRRGFAAMDPALVAAIASKGGKSAHALGTAHRFTSAEARAAGLYGPTVHGQARGRRAPKVAE